jgi:hypothetical protein
MTTQGLLGEQSLLLTHWSEGVWQASARPLQPGAVGK